MKTNDQQGFLSLVSHISQCRECQAVRDNFIAYVNSMPVAKEKGILREWTEDIAIGLAAQLGFHLSWGLYDMVFGSYKREVEKMRNPGHYNGPESPKVDPKMEQLQRDIMRIRRSVTGSDNQWSMPGEDKSVV